MPHARIRHFFRHGTLPQFAVFEATARLQSFTRAAEELHLAQPTVSIQIKKLTATIGVPLFEQIGKQVFLTESGRHLYQYCQQMFGEMAALEDTMADLRELRAGCLRLAAGTMANYYAPRMVAGFLQQFPGLDATLAIHNRGALIERLASNDDDLYLFAHPPEDRDIVRQSILANPLVVMARADHPLARQRNIPLERLAREPFLMREAGSGTRRAVEAAFAKQRLAPDVRMELASNEAIQQSILAGLGVSVLPRDTFGVDVGQPQLATLDVTGFPLERHWWFVYPVGRRLSPVAAAFMNFVRERVRMPWRDDAPGSVTGTPSRAAFRPEVLRV